MAAVMSEGERRSQMLDIIRSGYLVERVEAVWVSSSLLLSSR